MELAKNIYVYYDPKSEKILDFLPRGLDDNEKARIINHWNQPILRRILKLLSEQEKITAPRIRDEIGHSMSTLHENVKKLQNADLISVEMIYRGNKQKIITPKVFFVTQNPKFTAVLKKAANQGIWVDKDKTDKILEFLEKNKGEYMAAEDISRKTKIPVDEVRTLLENWDSQFNRSISDFLKKSPLERQIYYRFSK